MSGPAPKHACARPSTTSSPIPAAWSGPSWPTACKSRTGSIEARALAVAVGHRIFPHRLAGVRRHARHGHATERRGSPCAHVALRRSHRHPRGARLHQPRLRAALAGHRHCLPEAARLEASPLVTSCLGVQGILNGQSRDLQFHASARPGDVLEVAEGKTVTLIRLTLLLPALVAGASGPTAPPWNNCPPAGAWPIRSWTISRIA
jgi:hypothetical protein